ncbi:hypothetical protein [Sphingomonas sp.]|uniref:hypothetical protein n=1 Tax=Sphingomonas sp. TaxID=28214 RepID=UPI0035BC7852
MAGIGMGLAIGAGSTAGGSGGGTLPSLAFGSAIARAEGASGATVFTFTLALTRNGSATAIPFTWAVTGSGANPASASDFVDGVLPSGSGTFAAGETSKTVAVAVAGDSVVEPDEGFTVTASASVPLAGVSSTGAILNDDGAAAIVLGALGLSSTAFAAGGATSVGITGRTAGSALSATSSDGTVLSVAGTTLSGTFAAAGSPTIMLSETLASATNSPRTTAVGVTVSAVAGGLLALSERLAFGGNSYGAQTSNIDLALWAWIGAGCRGVPSIGMKQSRGGDRLSHLLDRIEPLKSVRAGLYVVMNPINDTNDIGGNTAADSDAILARFDAVAGALRSARPDARIIAETVGTGVTTYQSKPVSMARYEAGIDSRAGALLTKFSPNGVVDFLDAAQSSDQLHPNKRLSARAYGLALGAKIAGFFDTADVFAGGLSLANNLVAFNAATAWTATANSSALTAVQSQDVLRSRPGVACRRFVVTGTTTQDPASGGTAADLRLRVTLNLPAGLSTDGLSVGHVMLLEVQSSAGGDPVGLATLQLNGNVGIAFNKQYAAGDGSFWTERFQGPMGILAGADGNAALAGQTTQWNFDITLRAVPSIATDIEIRVAALNVLNTEANAYGPVKTMSKVFTVNDGTARGILRPVPTTTPSGGAVAVGATIAKSKDGFFVGGGITRQFDALRDGATDVGDLVPVRNGAAAVPYTAVAGDSGHTIVMRQSASNTFDGGMTSDYVDAIAVAVS